MSGINNAPAFGDSYLVNNRVTLADICFACEYGLFSHERTRGAMLTGVEVQPITLDAAGLFPKAVTHFENLCEDEAFSVDLAPFLSTDIFKTLRDHSSQDLVIGPSIHPVCLSRLSEYDFP